MTQRNYRHPVVHGMCVKCYVLSEALRLPCFQVSHVGPNLCFLVDTLTYIIAALCAYRLKVISCRNSVSPASFATIFGHLLWNLALPTWST
jgi:hypothetical protein